MKENPDIDELLNSFLDGELTDRQRNEVERLIAHDAEISRRLGELQKCKTLVGSLPFAEAPAEMAEQIKASAERKKYAAEQRDFERREGARQLLFRKVLAAAAMIGLVAILGVVIYSIVAPESAPEKPIVVKDWQPPVERVELRPAEKSIAEAGLAAGEFYGRLELKTNALIAVDGFINRAIENNDLSDCVSSRREWQGVKEYSLVCSREDAKLLLTDLGTIWEKLDSARLLVETDEGSKQVVVGNVRAEQIAEIISRDSSKSYADKAKYFAVLNRMEELLPGKEVLAAIDEGRGDLIAIPKPVLTSSEPIKKATVRRKGEEKVHLTIVLAGGE